MELAIGLLMGIAYTASPGPMMTETLRRGAAFGFGAAVAVRAGGLAGSLFFALLASSGMALFLQEGEWQTVLTVVCVLLLIYLGISTIKDRHILQHTTSADRTMAKPVHQTFFVGLTMSVFNPVALAFWLSLGSQSNDFSLNSALFMAGFFIGIVLVGLVIALVATYAMKWVSGAAAQVILSGCGLMLIWFGVKMGYGLVSVIVFAM